MSPPPYVRPTGPVRLVVFDWAGTVIDHGCRAPAAIFRTVFAAEGVTISEAEARAPMGLPKLDHIRAIGRAVTARWQAITGRPFDDTDAQALYARFLPLQISVVAQYADVIAGVAPVVADLRARGVRLGTTTGYTREILAACLDTAAAQGFVPDAMVCAGDLPTGRPGPGMMFHLMQTLDCYPPALVVKVGDTPVDMSEGRNAGAWAVGVSETGNELGLTAAELAALPEAERARRRTEAAHALTRAGAHLVIASVADLPAALAVIEGRLAAGESP